MFFFPFLHSQNLHQIFSNSSHRNVHKPPLKRIMHSEHTLALAMEWHSITRIYNKKPYPKCRSIKQRQLVIVIAKKKMHSQTTELPWAEDDCKSTLSISWYVIWNLGWLMSFVSDITKSGPFGKNLGLIWYSMFHKDDIQGSKAPSYLKTKPRILDILISSQFNIMLYLGEKQMLCSQQRMKTGEIVVVGDASFYPLIL